jgi:hypothetical protein
MPENPTVSLDAASKMRAIGLVFPPLFCKLYSSPFLTKKNLANTARQSPKFSFGNDSELDPRSHEVFILTMTHNPNLPKYRPFRLTHPAYVKYPVK